MTNERPEPRKRDSYRTPNRMSHRTQVFGRLRWTVLFLVIVAFVASILLFGKSEP